MKLKKYTLFLLAALFAGPSFASRIGFHGGLNMANVSTDPSSSSTSTDALTGVVAGAIFEVYSASILALELDINYINKGFKAAGISAKNTYLEVPLLLKLIAPTALIKPYAEFGPSIGLLLAADLAGMDVKSSYKSFDYGLNFGAGIEFSLGPVSLLLDGRYQLGLANILNSSAGTVKNTGIQLTGGLLFGF